MEQKPKPRRIRDANWRVPPLTDTQRAKIITVDLDNPPPFVRVLREISEVRTIVDEPDAAAEAWVYRPDWGGSAALFDRRTITVPRGHSQSYWLLNTFADADLSNKGQRHTAARRLKSPHAAAFIDNLRAVCLETMAQLPGCQSVSVGLDFEPALVPSDAHIDVIQLRGFMALEHGNVVLPDMAAARAAGFVFKTTTNAAHEQWELVDLIEAGVPVYNAALGHLTFMRGYLPPGRPTWHAAYPKNPAIPCYRPTIKADFTFG